MNEQMREGRVNERNNNKDECEGRGREKKTGSDRRLESIRRKVQDGADLEKKTEEACEIQEREFAKNMR